jgi:hypothetical protein
MTTTTTIHRAPTPAKILSTSIKPRTQVSGVDFQKSFSPAIGEGVFRISIMAQILNKLSAIVLDVEAAFLNGDFKTISVKWSNWNNPCS